MNTLEQFLDSYLGKVLNDDILHTYTYFGYTNEEIYKLHLLFLLNNVYTHIKLVDVKHKRLEQREFRQLLLEKYKTCIISKNSCLDELEACHIVEIKNNGNYSIDNGIILERNLHSTFDKNFWCINPYTLKIEIKENHKGSITKYRNVNVNIENFNPMLHLYLTKKYEIFLS